MNTLWLDLGNTRLKYWLTDPQGNILDHDAKLHLQAPAELLMGLADKFMRLNPQFIGVSSVLGQTINARIYQTLESTQIEFEFAKVCQHHPQLDSDYHPDQLGTDRWLQMIGAVNQDKRQCVIGCGTAMTIDLIDKGRHLGGYIFPNARLQRDALYAGTQQIDVQVGDLASTAPATNTSDAVNHGILLSIVGAINHTLHAYPDFEVIMTGGDAFAIAKHLDTSVEIEKNLLLTGLKKYFAKI